MFSVGVLAFLFVDVFEHGFAIVEEPSRLQRRQRGLGHAGSLLALLLGRRLHGRHAGLAMIERRMRHADRRRRSPAAPPTR